MATLGEELYAVFLVEEVIEEILSGGYVGDATFVELLSEIDDERDVIDEHGKSYSAGYPPIFRQMIEEARDLFHDGLRDDAITRLERLAHPKWSSEAECRKAYALHMIAQRAAQSPSSGDVP